MTDTADIRSGNSELNSFVVGLKWGCWHFLPIIGSIIVTIKVLNRLFATTAKKVWMFVFMAIPYVGIIGSIIYIILIIKRIGGRFFLGFLIVPLFVISGLLAIIAVPVYQKALTKARFSEVPVIFASYENQQKIYISENGSAGDLRAIDMAIPESKWLDYQEISAGTLSAKTRTAIGKVPAGAIFTTTIGASGDVEHGVTGVDPAIAKLYLPRFLP